MSIPPGCRIGFLGAGNMAEAILRGLISSGACQPGQLLITDIKRERVHELQDALGVGGATDASTLVAGADVVVLAVKPQGIADLLASLAGQSRPNQLWISILAGTTAPRLEAMLAHDGSLQPRVVRVMPNTPALVGAGASGICAGSHAGDDDLKLATLIFRAVGIAEVVAPEMMDAITGLTGSGPAYVFRMIESLIAAGESQGLDADQTARLVKQMVFGAAKMAMESEHDPGELRRRVTSPGGTTAEGLKVLDEAGFHGLMNQVVAAAAKRSKELAGG